MNNGPLCKSTEACGHCNKRCTLKGEAAQCDLCPCKLLILLLSHLSVLHWKTYTKSKTCTRRLLVAKGT